MEFQKHTSSKMVELFNRKPYQGQSPEKAKIIFLSSDANYSPEISNHSFFDYILEYQEDGVTFWKKYGCHHPFLLKNYPFNKNKAGVPFHRNFSKLEFDPAFAEHITFLELLDIPTIGNKTKNIKLFFSLISEPHLKYIEELMLGGGEKIFFVSKGVLKDILKLKNDYRIFEWLDYKIRDNKKYKKYINGNKIQEINHFSSAQIHGQVEEISSTIRSWIKKYS